MSDIGTIIWKEIRDLFFQGSRSDLIRPLLFIAILGIFVPLQQGTLWLSLPPLAILLVVYVPFVYVSSFICDAIAGERERHTLETLLASRIPDYAILLGKLIVTVAYTWAIAILGLLLGWLMVNLSSGQVTWHFYAPLGILAEVLVLSLLTCLLAASGGVLISLRSATVRQAQQILLVCSLGMFVLGGIAIQFIPLSALAGLTVQQILLIIMLVVTLLDGILVGIGLGSFRRSRLILS
jgi:ABC-2 type transport system permease protein